MRRFEGFELVNSTDMSGPTLEAKLPQTVARMCLMHKWDNSKDMYMLYIYIYIYIYAHAFPGYSSAKRLMLRDACGGQLVFLLSAACCLRAMSARKLKRHPFNHLLKSMPRPCSICCFVGTLSRKGTVPCTHGCVRQMCAGDLKVV